MGHHLYEENKRLKEEIERLQEAARQRRGLDDDAQIDVLAREALKQILTGKAMLVTTPGNQEHDRFIYFQMLPMPKPADTDPF